MVKTPDELIIEGLACSELDKFIEIIYKEYYDGIEEYILYRGGIADDAGDIFQEALLIMVEKVRSGKFRGESSIKTFLYGIVKNLWMMEMRTRERRKKREEYYSSNEPIVEDAGFRKRYSATLEPVFNELGQICKEILIGFYFHNKPMKELLIRFEFKNEQVLRNRKALCMKKLKELISSDENLMTTLKSDYVYE